ncbi:sensor histidine kinase [Qipengyuania sp. DGS5-3]|uniref:sensor histidine kinase n=1 Tax=Qipengyuania sp. DGS5-3 TaxID=3349632 RepID=UPI0036D24BAF
MAIALIGVAILERSAAHREQLVLEQLALQKSAALSQGALATDSVMRMGAALLSVKGNMSEQSVERFASTVLHDRDNHGAKDVAFTEVEALGDGSLTGVDEQSNDAVRMAMERAWRFSRPVAVRAPHPNETSGSGEPNKMLVFMPVFLETASTTQASSADLVGFLRMTVDLDVFLKDALELLEPEQLVLSEEVAVELYDGQVEEANLLAGMKGSFAGTRLTERQFSFAGKPLTLAIWSTQSLGLERASWITLIAGLFLALLAALSLRLLARQVTEDAIAFERLVEQNSIRDSLSLELNHRVRNTLANILSMIALNRHRTDDLQGFAEELDGRVRSLAATHELLTQSEWGTIPIADVVETELGSYMGDPSRDVSTLGPMLELAPKDALSLGLAMHELVTNAAKYGALSAAGGKVSVWWRAVSDELAQIDWEERDGPPITSPPEAGFGVKLIEKITAHELQQPVKLEFNEAGVRCTFLVSVRAPDDFELRSPRE